MVQVNVAPNVDHSAGASRPDPALIAIVVHRSSYNVPMVKLISKSLLGLLPHDAVTCEAEPQIAGVI